MSDAAFAQFVAPESEWIHDAIAVAEKVFGVADVDVDTDEENHLVVTVTCDPIAA